MSLSQDLRQGVHSFRKWIQHLWISQEWLSLDLRSLALFRIALAAVLLVDVFRQWHDIPAFYSDAGVLPRSLVPEFIASNYRIWSLHMLGGSDWFEHALFCAEFMVALGLLVGWRTFSMTLLCWIFVISRHGRNPFILTEGDTLLRLLLFWSLFLPLGACVSLDALRSPSSRNPRNYCFRSTGTVGLILQTCFIYWFAAGFKSGPSWHQEGTAVHDALRYQPLARPFAAMMLHFPGLLTNLTHATPLLEIFCPALLLVAIRTWPRVVACVLFAAFHILLGICLDLGLFPFVCVVLWTAFLPTAFWNRFGSRMFGSGRSARIRRLEKLVQRLVVRAPAWLRARKTQEAFCRRHEVQAVAAAFTLYIFCWNLRTTHPTRFEFLFPSGMEGIGYFARLDQDWSMFAPDPPRDGGWALVVGHTTTQETCDLFTGLAPSSWHPPPCVNDYYPNQRWIMYVEALRDNRNVVLFRSFCSFLALSTSSREFLHVKFRGHIDEVRFYYYFRDQKIDPFQVEGLIWKQRF